MNSLLQKHLNDTYRSLLRNMGVWDKNFFKDFFPALLQNKTTIMSKLSLCSEISAKKISERNSYFLGKESFSGFTQKVENRCFGLVGKIKNNDYICVDEVDIAKPRARKMEGISKIWDSSQKKVVSGYMYHGVSIAGIPVILQREDLENKMKSEYFGNIVKRVKKHTKGKGIFVLDALYDTKNYMDFLLNEGCHFIVRAKRQRILYNEKGESLGKMKSFKEGTYEVYLKQEDNSLTRVYFYVKQFQGYSAPMRIYSDSPKRDILEYKKRWDIECIFKTMKQEYKMESIQAGSLQVIENMVATLQMAVALLHHLYRIQYQSKGNTFFQCSITIKKMFKKYTKWKGYTMNRNAFIGFISYFLQNTKKEKQKVRKKSHTSKVLFSSQLCLF